MPFDNYRVKHKVNNLYLRPLVISSAYYVVGHFLKKNYFIILVVALCL